MAQYCENCKKFMKNPDLTHCSDECLLDSIRNSTSIIENGINAISWDERTDPWT